MIAFRASPLTFVLLVIAGMGGSACPRAGQADVPSRAQPSSGGPAVEEEIFAIDLNLVTGLEYASGVRQVAARRPGGSSDPFSITVSDAGKVVEQCRAGAQLTAILTELGSIRARPLPDPERRSLSRSDGGDIARVRILDDTVVGPQEYGVLLDPRSQTAVLLEGDKAYASRIPNVTFTRLAGGCSTLGVGRKGSRK